MAVAESVLALNLGDEVIWWEAEGLAVEREHPQPMQEWLRLLKAICKRSREAGVSDMTYPKLWAAHFGCGHLERVSLKHEDDDLNGTDIQSPDRKLVFGFGGFVERV